MNISIADLLVIHLGAEHSKVKSQHSKFKRDSVGIRNVKHTHYELHKWQRNVNNQLSYNDLQKIGIMKHKLVMQHHFFLIKHDLTSNGHGDHR